MPINIYSEDDSQERVAWLCDDCWRLPDQIDALEAWLAEHKTQLRPGRYVADVGFMIRPEACGGGAVISPEMMGAMAALGMSLYLSEYPSEDRDEATR